MAADVAAVGVRALQAGESKQLGVVAVAEGTSMLRGWAGKKL